MRLQTSTPERAAPGSAAPDTRASRRLTLGRAGDEEAAARELAAGSVVAYGFANFYALTSRPDAATVRALNLLKGRPAGQVGSITTTPLRIPLVFDWAQLPERLPRHAALDLMDALLELGPVGFRGPAAPGIPPHLTSPDAGTVTTQVIVPGHACPSNRFLARSLAASRSELLYITSANRSRHLSGAPDEPAHYRAAALAEEFAGSDGFLLLEHPDEAAVQRRYRLHAPVSTTIVALHKLAEHTGGPPRLVVERHGSLDVARVRAVAAPLGLDVELGPQAQARLRQRDYLDRAVPQWAR